MPQIDGKRILVLGNAGFISSHIVDLLTQKDVREVIIYETFHSFLNITIAYIAIAMLHFANKKNHRFRGFH